MKKHVSLLALFLLFAFVFSAASFADTTILDDQSVRSITLTGKGAEFHCGGVTASGSVITVSAPGIYSFTGTLDDGQIVVRLNSDEQAELILSNVTITCLTGPAIYVSNADKVTIKLEDGTVNTVTSGTEADVSSYDESRSGAAIYADDDLKFKGKGTLHVTGNLNNGIACKNDIDIKNCTIHVEAVNNGIKGKDSVEISDATVEITAGNDGIKTDTEKAAKGYVTIVNSSLTILADEGISATGQITIVPQSVS